MTGPTARFYLGRNIELRRLHFEGRCSFRFFRELAGDSRVNAKVYSSDVFGRSKGVGEVTLETFSPGQKLRQEAAKACRSFPEKDKGVPRGSTGRTYRACRSSGDVEEGFKPQPFYGSRLQSRSFSAPALTGGSCLLSTKDEDASRCGDQCDGGHSGDRGSGVGKGLSAIGRLLLDLRRH